MGGNWRVVGILALLAGFGALYNLLVAWMQRKGHDEGYLAFLVAVGVAVTLVGWGLITGHWVDLLLLVGCFVMSGTPMILGSIARYMRLRAQDREAERAHVRRVLNG